MTINARNVDKMLRANGYVLARSNGHKIYTKKGCKSIAVPKSCNRRIIARLIKENNLIIKEI